MYRDPRAFARAHGLVDVPLFDLETQRGFFVAVALYANPDGILNDDGAKTPP